MYNNFSSKKTKKVISALLASALVVTSAPITANAATKKVVGVGKTVTYKAGATVKKITVKNKKVVKATKSKKSKKNVVLKGLKAGKTTVTIKTSKKTIKLNVCVGATKITKKTLKTTMTAGGKQTVSVTAAGGKGDTITFTSSKKSVLKVNKASAKASAKGIAKMSVAAVAEGTAKLTVASKNTGVKKAFTIKVVAATPAPATQPPTVATTPAVTGTATAVATTPAVQATATAAVPGATNAPGTDVTLAPGETTAPGSTDAASTDAPANTDAVATPGATDPAATEVPFDPETATQGAITVNTNVSGASISVISGGAAVYTAKAKNTETSISTSILAPGTYTVEITKKGYDKVTQSVTVNGDVTIDVTMKESIQTGLNFKVENSLSEYENTVLVNDQAIVTANLKDAKGNPIANKTVVLSSSVYAHSNDVGVMASDYDYKIKGNDVVTTDANGNASFVVGLDNTSGIKVTDTKHIATVNFTASVVGDASLATKGYVRFAAISVNNLKNLNGDSNTVYKDKTLLAGTNAQTANGGSKNGSETTHDINGTSTTYIYSQQVSSEDGKVDNKVYFSASPKIVLTGTNIKTDSESTYFNQKEELVSDAYHTYAKDPKKLVVKEDMSQLLYATVNVDKLELSPYTYMDVEFFTDEACTESFDSGNSDKKIGDDAGDGIATEQEEFGIQIPKTADISGKYVKGIKFTLRSAGQVETDKNSGYKISGISGVYKSAETTAEAGGSSDLTSAKITWKAIKPLMSDSKELPAGDASTVLAGNYNAASKYTYQVPVFPYTGDAVITEKDATGKLVAYWLAPTKNKHDGTEYVNENIINTSGKKAYKATTEEVSNYLTTGVSQNGNIVTVESTKAGSTTLMGTLSIEDGALASNITNDATTTIYTSVQWNPIPNNVDTVDDGTYPFFAIAGQNITVKAQLTDMNGNKVSKAGIPIDFYENGVAITGATTISKTSTDTNGVATIVLNRATAGDLKKLTATCSSDNDYNVTMTVGKDTKVIGNKGKAELHWVDANLKFEAAVDEPAVTNPTSGANTTNNDTVNVSVKDPVLGTPWEYAVKTVAGTLGTTKTDITKFQGKEVEIQGLKVNTTFDEDNKGTYKVIGNGVVSAESGIKSKDTITNKLNESCVNGDVTFKIVDADKKTHEFVCVGEGTPNLSAKLNLGVDWQISGYKAEVITPLGTTIKADSITTNQTQTTLYVKITDELGKNVAAGTPITYNVSSVKGNSASKEMVPDTQNTTDANGVVAIAFDNAYTGASTYDATSSVVTVKIDNTDVVVSKTINWDTTSTLPVFGVVKAQKSGEKELTVTFNNNISAVSVNPNEFVITGEDSKGNKAEYSVTKAVASGKSVVLTLSEALGDGQVITVKVNKATTSKGITYSLADEIGQTVKETTPANATDTNIAYCYTTKNAEFDLNPTINNTANKIEIQNLNTMKDLVFTNGGGSAGLDDASDTTDAFIVTVNGIIDQSATTAYDGTNNWIITLGAPFATGINHGDVIKVSYLGTTETYTYSDSQVVALEKLNENFANTTDTLLISAGITNVNASNVGTYKTNLAAAKVTKGSDLTQAEIQAVIDKTDLNEEAASLKTAMDGNTYVASAGSKTVTTGDGNVAVAVNGTAGTLITGITTPAFTVADADATESLTVRLTKNGKTLDITLEIDGDGAGAWTCAASYTALTF